MMCHVLIHPRVAIFPRSLISLSQEQEIAGKQDCVTAQHTYMDMSKDGHSKPTSGQVDGNYHEENTGSILEKPRDSNDSTITFTLVNIANGNLNSKNCLANTNKDTFELEIETQHGTSELSRDSQHDVLELGTETLQYNEEMILLADKKNERVREINEQATVEQYENMKRPRSERLEQDTNERTDKIMSEVIGDTIPAVKKRKMQDETSCSNMVEDVQNSSDENGESIKRFGKEILEPVEVIIHSSN